MNSLPTAAKLLFAWAAFWNLAAFCAMGLDKAQAKRGGWRIPERRLFLFAALGGALGSLLGMRAFHHKTLHKAFRIGMPALLILNLLLYGLLAYLLLFMP